MALMAETLDRAHDAHRRGDWARAFDLFVAAREVGDLAADDLSRLSRMAWWLGHVETLLDAGASAFHAFVAADRSHDAALKALELGMSLCLRGEEEAGSGWIGRAERQLMALPEGPAHGYVRYVMTVEAGLAGDDMEGVAEAARQVAALGRRHDDPNLVALGAVGEGRSLVKRGEVAAGMRLLDEAMVDVAGGDLEPEWVGNIYCHCMAACHEVGNIRRARRWSEATMEWLEEMPAAVVFTGICRVHRCQVFQATGEWTRAEQEASRVCDDLSGLHVASVAEAHYRVGELHRLRGELWAADAAFVRSRELGRDPQPGLALSQLARGRTGSARDGIRVALHACPSDPLARAPLSAARVEIEIAGGDLDAAAEAASELHETANRYGTGWLEAAAHHWRGALAVADRRPEEALVELRDAIRRWSDLRAPYDTARAQLLLSRAYRALGDHDAAETELALARRAFETLGAALDVLAVDACAAKPSPPAGLTAREVEVLRLVAAGRTNHEVAVELVLSEKTIARHLSNIFTKLGTSTRTEAAAFAFEHRLLHAGSG